jgi:hypothetical protein
MAAHELDEYVEELRLPLAMQGRAARSSSSVKQLVDAMNKEIDDSGRRFVPGLLMAFVAMAEAASEYVGQERIKGVLGRFDRERLNQRGGRVNTLNLILGEDATIRLRPYYSAAEHVFVNSLRRYDYPNMAPHATQAWSQHEAMLTAVFALSGEERRAVAEAIMDRVLKLPEYRRRSIEDARPRPFALLLDESRFPGTQRGEPRGAILQGLAFAYYRADSPNVTIETGKAGAGSKRTGRIGDVDGWSGPELVLSIEVKDEDLTDPADSALDGFIANLAEWPDATAIVVARRATDEILDSLSEQNVSMLTREAMVDSVVRWDLNKQQIATREFHYYLVRVQRHSGLISRFEEFLSANLIEL